MQRCRIPGSVNVPAASLFDPTAKTFITPAEAKAKFEQQGVTKDKQVICYCGGGISATAELIKKEIADGFMPVISPVAEGLDGKPYNVNADLVAGRVASALRARRLAS